MFFDDVRVPVANLIGEENKGWTYAKSLLGHERTAIAGVGDSQARAPAAAASSRAARRSGGKPLLDDPLFRRPAGATSRSS